MSYKKSTRIQSARSVGECYDMDYSSYARLWSRTYSVVVGCIRMTSRDRFSQLRSRVPGRGQSVATRLVVQLASWFALGRIVVLGLSLGCSRSCRVRPGVSQLLVFSVKYVPTLVYVFCSLSCSNKLYIYQLDFTRLDMY